MLKRKRTTAFMYCVASVWILGLLLFTLLDVNRHQKLPHLREHLDLASAVHLAQRSDGSHVKEVRLSTADAGAPVQARADTAGGDTTTVSAANNHAASTTLDSAGAASTTAATSTPAADHAAGSTRAHAEPPPATARSPPPTAARGPPAAAATGARAAALAARVTLAVRNGTYPLLKFPRFADQHMDTLPAGTDLSPDKRPNPWMVLAYHGSFWGMSWQSSVVPCYVPCMLTSDAGAYAQRADVAIFHGPSSGSLDRSKKRAGQLYALHSMESQGYYPQQAAGGSATSTADIQMTTKNHPVEPRLLHVPCAYANLYEYHNYTLVRPSMLNKTGFGTFMHNNCGAHSRRQYVVELLMGLLPEGMIHCPGNCLHNYDPPNNLQSSDPAELVSRYKFYFSFENVFDDPDWVSSTFFRNLDAGTVPVYLGAPNILKYAPGKRSIIRACDFETPQDLLAYLLYLHANDTAYQEFLTWKRDGPSPEFLSMVGAMDTSPFCVLCMLAAEHGTGGLERFDEPARAGIASYKGIKAQYDALNARLDAERTVPCKASSNWWRV